MMRLPRHAALLALTISCVAHGAQAENPAEGPAAKSAADPNQAFAQEFGDRFFKAYWPLHPDQAIAVGYYQVADRLTVLDARERAGELRFLDRQLARLHSYQPDTLDDAHRTDQALRSFPHTYLGVNADGRGLRGERGARWQLAALVAVGCARGDLRPTCRAQQDLPSCSRGYRSSR